MSGFLSQGGTLVALTAQTFNFPHDYLSLCYINDDGTATHRIVTNGQTVNVLPGQSVTLTGCYGYQQLVIGGDAGSTGAYRVVASPLETPPAFSAVSNIVAPAAGSITTAMLANDVLSADATGRGKMQAGFFGLVAASVAHFVDGFFTATVVAAKFAANSIGYAKLPVKGVVTLANADATLTAAQLVTGGVFTITPTALRILTTATAAQIVAAITGASVGTSFDFSVVNLAGGAFSVELAGGLGVTLVGAADVIDIATESPGSGTFRVILTNVTGGAEAVTIYRIG